MVFEISPVGTPASSQYDADSAPNQNQNCGPTTVVNSLRYHLDKKFGIEATRNLATSVNGTGTNIAQRKIMFDKRGLPASVRHLDPSSVKNMLNGRRAFDIALLMGKMPLSIRKRPFTGSHSVEGIAIGIATCPVHNKREAGIWVHNPDYHRDRGPGPKAFYPDHAWIPAYLALGGWCVVPNKDKATRSSYKKACKTTATVNIRSGPSTRHTVVKKVGSGFAFTSIQLERAGGVYTASGKTRRDWLSFSLNGRLVWVARGYVKEG